jgi:glutathione peroxidase
VKEYVLIQRTIEAISRAIFNGLNCFIPGARRLARAPQSAPDIYPFKATTLRGKPFDFASTKGKVLLICNTASECGFTYQYKGLQELYLEYSGRGLEVLGFPSNDFMGQEPGDSSEIAQFCEMNFGVTFPLFEKKPVTGEDLQPIFHFLTKTANPTLAGEVHWNFEKFLIDRSGHLVARFNSLTDPDKIAPEIEKLLSS